MKSNVLVYLRDTFFVALLIFIGLWIIGPQSGGWMKNLSKTYVRASNSSSDVGVIAKSILKASSENRSKLLIKYHLDYEAKVLDKIQAFGSFFLIALFLTFFFVITLVYIKYHL